MPETAAPDADRRLIADAFRQLGLGVAIADAADFYIRWENARFFQLFPPPVERDDGQALTARLPGIDPVRLAERIARGRPYALDVEAKLGARSVHLAVELHRQEHDGAAYLLVEARDVSKQRETEYMLDSYSRMAERRQRELEREKERVEKLLLNLMPRSVYQELRDFGSATPQRFDSASVLMLDFVGFTQMSVARDPASIVAELNDIFSAFDRIVELFGCERIKTIGDAYLCVSGVPDPNVDHAASIARTALRFRRYLEKRNQAHPNQWRCRVGIHTGALIGSLVGIQKYVYDVFGPAVNMAARLEAMADPMQICLTADTQALLSDQFVTAPLGPVDVRGFGPTDVFELTGERAR